jgi:hypothetical protein
MFLSIAVKGKKSLFAAIGLQTHASLALSLLIYACNRHFDPCLLTDLLLKILVKTITLPPVKMLLKTRDHPQKQYL